MSGIIYLQLVFCFLFFLVWVTVEDGTFVNFCGVTFSVLGEIDLDYSVMIFCILDRWILLSGLQINPTSCKLFYIVLAPSTIYLNDIQL